MSQDTLISVKFQGYCLEIRMALNSQIFDVVQILRDNDFVSSDIRDGNLQFKKKNKTPVKGTDMVQTLIQPGENSSSCQLIIQINMNLKVEQEKQEQAEQKLNKFLGMVVKHLNIEQPQYQKLISYKESNKLSSETAKHLHDIGKAFQEVTKKSQFYLKAFVIIDKMIKFIDDKKYGLDKNDADKELKQISESHGDFVKTDETYSIFLNIRKMMQKAQNLTTEKSNLQKQIATLIQKNKELKKTADEQKAAGKKKAEELQNQLQKKTTQSNKLENELNFIKFQNGVMKNNQLKSNSSIQSLNKQISELKNNISILQAKKSQLQIQLSKEKDNVKKQVERANEVLRQLEKKEEELTKIKEEYGGEEIMKYLGGSQKATNVPTSLVLSLENILGGADQAQQLRKTITKEMRKKPILSIKQLFSFDHRVHQGYSFKGTFGKLLDNRRSLLFIGRSESEDKVFGAFTEEKYESDPQDGSFTDFKGCAFLFTYINKEMKYFKHIPGENSITYDPNFLVFGNDDLVLNFDTNKCTSKFAQRRSIIYESKAAGSNDNENYKKLVSDLLNPKTECNMAQYVVYEVQFSEN